MEPGISERERWDSLTKRQKECIEAYDRCGSYNNAAQDLGISVQALDANLIRAREKLGVPTTAAALRILGSIRAEDALRDGRLPASSEKPKIFQRMRTVLLTTCGAILLLSFWAFGTHSAHGSVPNLGDLTINEQLDQLVRQLKSLAASGGKDSADRKRSELTSQIALLCWQAMWGASEEYFKVSLNPVSGDLHEAVVWDLQNDPQAAAVALGNGHRILCKLDAFSDWKELVDHAASARINWNTLEAGRLLCGEAFAHWADDPARGYRAAKRALHIFQQIGQAPWDEANALRHMGLCIEYPATCSTHQDIVKLRVSFDDRALAIYRRIGDKRGQYMTELSLAEGPLRGSARIAVCVDAAKGFLLYRNSALFYECISQFPLEERSLPQQRDDADRILIRDMYLKCADMQLRTPDESGFYETMGICLALDSRLSHRELWVEDLAVLVRAIISGRAGYFNGGDMEVVKLYLDRCKRLSLQPDPAAVRYYDGRLGANRRQIPLITFMQLLDKLMPLGLRDLLFPPIDKGRLAWAKSVVSI